MTDLSSPAASSERDGPARPIHAAWQAGRPARNAWLTIPDPYLAEIVAARGEVEAVTLDLQHGLFENRVTVEAIRAIALRGKAPLARLSANEAAPVGFLLDAGAAGIIAPMVESVGEAEHLVSACRYPPKGRRSYGPTRGGLDRSADPIAAAEQTLLFVMIETARGLDVCEDLAAVDGVSGIFVGPGDLGLSMGIGAGQDREETEIHDALARVAKACRAAGKRCAVHAGSARYAARMASQGYDLVTVWVDAVAIAASLAEADKQWAEQARA
jgi:4-hydroxy-2-oxoheptanedioate aldolase